MNIWISSASRRMGPQASLAKRNLPKNQNRVYCLHLGGGSIVLLVPPL